MASSLFVLLDDIASVLDDVATLTQVATRKTAGVLGDDLALNAQQVAGVQPDRELPVVWAVFKGSVLNKVVLVPSALLISAWLPWAVTPLLMAGGLYLCFEGFEKLAHRFLQSPAQRAVEHEQRLRALMNEQVDLRAVEKDKISGAIRTDFILSAEIITLTLAMVQGQPMVTQWGVMAGVAALMTVTVYGLVAGIVKLDDAGLHLSDSAGPGLGARAARRLGRGLLAAAPWLMKFLSFAGAAAMFLVGGGILAHGWPWWEYRVEALAESAGHALAWAEAPTVWLLHAATGLLAGALALAIWLLVKRWLPATQAPAA